MSKIFGAIESRNVLDFGRHLQTGINGERLSSKPAEPGTDDVRLGATSSREVRSFRMRTPAFGLASNASESESAAAEQYRIIRTKLLHSEAKRQIVVVSSGSSGDGKTVTSANIAVAMALKSDSHILLIDGDLRHPRVHAELDVPNGPGLSDVLLGEVSLKSALIRCEQFPNLFVVPAGIAVANPSELLDSSRWFELLGQVRSQFPNIIIDAPPVESVADYELLQLAADGVVLVIRPDHSNRRAAFSALSAVPKQKLLGTVMNCVKDWWLWKTPGYSSYRAYVSKQSK